MIPAREPYLSIVAAYSGPEVVQDAERFAELFVWMLATQARRFDLPIEVILVDWRPGKTHQALSSLPVAWPATDESFNLSIITAGDTELAESPHAIDRGFQERIAQNIGIRRAHGRFVLAATIETILSDALAAALAGMDLSPAVIPIPLRLNVDTPAALAQLPRAGGTSYESYIAACVRSTLSASFYPHYVAIDTPPHAGDLTLDEVLQRFRERHPELRAPAPTYGAVSYLLMAREHWQSVRGFPEWPVVDQLLDRLVLALAQLAELRPRLLPLEQCYFHLGRLRPRLVDRPLPVRRTAGGIPTLARPSEPLGNFHEGQMIELIENLLDRMRQLKTPVHYNGEDWGLGARTLPVLRPAGRGD